MLTIVQKKTELEDVRQLIMEYVQELDRDLSFQNLDRELQTLQQTYCEGRSLLLVAYVDGQAAGCVAIHPWNDATCEMKRLYVRPLYRQLHIGRMLAEAILRGAHKLGYKRMVLDTIRPLQAAIGLYRSLGFVEIEPYYDNPMPDVLYFGKVLSGDGHCSN